MSKKVLIATGGTGGHIYPAVALAQKFAEMGNDYEVLFIGGGLCQNRYFDKSEFDYRTISCGTFTGRSLFSMVRTCWDIAKGIGQSSSIIRTFKPDVAVGFGSYYSLPPMIAARMHSVPIVLHEANSIPGKVNRLLAPLAFSTGVHFPQTLDHLKGMKSEVGMPLRKGFKKIDSSRNEAIEYFGLKKRLKTLLIFGGSQGANIINRQFPEALKKINGLQVIHITGDGNQANYLKDKYKKIGIEACVKVFEDKMGLAWQASDLVVSRAGASSIAEQMEFEVPGILIPFAKAADDHQNHNADFLVRTVGGAVKVQEVELSSEVLGELISTFLESEGQLLKKMKAAMNNYKKENRTCDLYTLVLRAMGK